MTADDPTVTSPHVLVLGASKTGTTGVYASVRRGLRDAGIRCRTIFEPNQADTIDGLFRLAPGVPLLAKVTLDRLDLVVPDIRVFDRRVLTVRDPRDVLVSALLFRPLTARAVRRLDEGTVERFVTALEEKEADPASHSLLGLYRLARRLGIGGLPFRQMVADMDRQGELVDQNLVHVLHYERFIRGDLGDLSDHLGLEVVNTSARDATWFGHIARSQTSGDYTRWFHAEDLAYFNTLFGNHLRAFGYPLDVELDPEPKIDPTTSSEYVREGFRRRRLRLIEGSAQNRSPTDVDSQESLQRLVERAEDGDATACVRAAQVYAAGHLGPVDDESALHWARAGAQLGSVTGMLLVIELLERLDPDDPALRRELRVWRAEAQAQELRECADVLRRDHARLERELAALRRSARLRAGALLAAAARDPWRAGPRVAREMLRLASGRTRGQ